MTTRGLHYDAVKGIWCMNEDQQLYKIEDDERDMQEAQWILDRAERIKRQRRIHQIEQWLIVAVVIIVAVLILIVLRW
jgi:t-SNARE complex subunit (syntaxin)